MKDGPSTSSGTILKPTFAEAFRFWLKLGFVSFGGPTGQIAIMHTELVERRRWVSESQFLHALNFCMLLPGPEAQQLATYIGWLLHRTSGGIVAGTLFVLPSAFILWLLSYLYVTMGTQPMVASVLWALHAAVIGIVADAVVRIGRKALRNRAMWLLAAAAFGAIFAFHAPFPLIIVAAALTGWIGSRFAPFLFAAAPAHGGAENEAEASAAAPRSHWLAHAARVLVVCGALWWSPVLAAGMLLGWTHVLTQQGVFFSQAALVTFGGAYAVLPFVAQQAVQHYGWLSAEQMLAGLGLAETTPGPLIMVLQFVGFVGAWQHPAPFSPLIAATLGAAMTTWCTFLPCFLWIFLGAPYIEQLRRYPQLGAALTAITAAVVGVVLNLAVWFAMHVVWRTDTGIDYVAAAIAVAAFVGLWRFKVSILLVVAAAAGMGVLRQLSAT